MAGRFSIGELAQDVGVPTSTVRFYERKGLLRPAGRTDGNHRYYDAAALARLRFIRTAHDAGFTLQDALWYAVTGGCAVAAIFAFMMLVRASEDDALRSAEAQVSELRKALDRAEALLACDDQKTIVWDTPDSSPQVLGALPERVGAPFDRKEFLAKGRLLGLQVAVADIDRLRDAAGVPREDEIAVLVGRRLPIDRIDFIAVCRARFARPIDLRPLVHRPSPRLRRPVQTHRRSPVNGPAFPFINRSCRHVYDVSCNGEKSTHAGPRRRRIVLSAPWSKRS